MAKHCKQLPLGLPLEGQALGAMDTGKEIFYSNLYHFKNCAGLLLVLTLSV